MTDNLRPDADWQDFLRHSQQLSDLRGIDALLGWDQSTYQPPAAAEGRSRQMALLSRLIHAHATDAGYGNTLDTLAGRGDLDPVQTRMLALARKDFEQSRRLP